MTSKLSLYECVTQSIISAIEANPGKPALPWHRDASAPLFMPANALTGNLYQGINTVVLWVSAEQQGYSNPVWGTYRQWAELGCQVRKGEKSAPVIFYKSYDVTPESENPDDDGKRRVARASAVFNCAQVDGFTEPAAVPDLGPVVRNQTFDAFVAATGAVVTHGGDRAFYRPSVDSITMPDETRFCGTETMTRDESYISVLAHELGHWSGATSRLNREFGKRFGDAAYVAEEITAELCAAFISAELGIACTPRTDHAQYIAQYLQLLKSDSHAIFTAAAKASQAVAYLKAFSDAEAKAA
jgi:antirestriction protein ArdC